MKYLHLAYAIISVISFSPFFVLGWMANEAQAAFHVGRRECANYNSGPLLKSLNDITGG